MDSRQSCRNGKLGRHPGFRSLDIPDTNSYKSKVTQGEEKGKHSVTLGKVSMLYMSLRAKRSNLLALGLLRRFTPRNDRAAPRVSEWIRKRKDCAGH